MSSRHQNLRDLERKLQGGKTPGSEHGTAFGRHARIQKSDAEPSRLHDLERKCKHGRRRRRETRTRAFDVGTQVEVRYPGSRSSGLSSWMTPERSRPFLAHLELQSPGSQNVEMFGQIVPATPPAPPLSELPATDSNKDTSWMAPRAPGAAKPPQQTRQPSPLTPPQASPKARTAAPTGKPYEPEILPATHGGDQASDEAEDSFEDDLKAILGGLPTKGQREAQKQKEAEAAAPEPLSQSHAIFDRMAENMAYANTFDVGSVSLSRRLDELDGELEREELDNRHSSQETFRNLDLHDIEVAEDLAMMSESVPYEIDPQVPPRRSSEEPAGGGFPSSPAPFGPKAPAATREAEPHAEQRIPLPVELFEDDKTSHASSRARARGAAESHPTSAPRSTVYEVPLVAAQSTVSAWAASAAMLIAWREKLAVDPVALAHGTGPWSRYAEGLTTEDPSLFEVWDLIPKPPQAYTVDEFQRLLQDHGPLWVAGATPGKHVRLVTGIQGDGSPDGTIVHINDPWQQGMTEFRMPNAGAQYTETYRAFLARQSELASSNNSTGGLYVAHL